MKLLYGTTNNGKLQAMKNALKNFDIELIGLNDLEGELPRIKEDGDTPLENAELKARAYYEAFHMPVFSCDSGLYFEELSEEEQPGLHVRRIGGKELTDEEMIEHYAALAEKHGGKITGRYRNAIYFILDESHHFSSMDLSIATEPFVLVTKPHEKRVKGFPLDSLSVDIATGKYYYDLEVKDVSTSVDDGVRAFFRKALNEKVVIVTGANSGMGRATAAALADMGATVVMLCRNEKRGREALDILSKKSERKLELMLCDLGDFSSIRTFTDAFRSKYKKLDILVNNAGFISLDRQTTKDGLERQFGVNHIGHFLLTMRLIDLIPKGGRIINVSSGAHKTGKIHFDDINLTKGFNVIKAYSQSKLANVLFTRELARRLKGKGITVNCCHPGAVATNIGISRETGFGKTITGILKPFFQTPEQGARTTIYLASCKEVAGITGAYFYKCKVAKSSKRSKDINLAKRLFDFSEEIVGSKYSL